MVRAVSLVFALLMLAAVDSFEEDPNAVLSRIIKDIRNAPDGPAGKEVYNKACDGLLANINNAIIREKHHVEKIPDIDEKFSQKISGVDFNGYVKASNGRVGNLASLKRISDTAVKKSENGNKIEVAVIVTLSSFSVQYQNYSSYINGMTHEGRIDVYAKQYSASFKVSVDINGSECAINLDKFKIQQLEGISVVVVPTNPTLMTYLNWYMANEKDNRIKDLEEVLVKEGRKALEQFKCNLSL